MFPRARLVGGDKAFETLTAEVLAFVEDPAKGLDLPLDVRGTAFQHRVWEALRRIPAGSTASYAEIAKAIGAAGEELESTFKGEDTDYKMLEIVFPNGSRIIGLPANPDTARGWSSNNLLDEVALPKDSRAICRRRSRNFIA